MKILRRHLKNRLTIKSKAIAIINYNEYAILLEIENHNKQSVMIDSIIFQFTELQSSLMTVNQQKLGKERYIFPKEICEHTVFIKADSSIGKEVINVSIGFSNKKELLLPLEINFQKARKEWVQNYPLSLLSNEELSEELKSENNFACQQYSEGNFHQAKELLNSAYLKAINMPYDKAVEVVLENYSRLLYEMGEYKEDIRILQVLRERVDNSQSFFAGTIENNLAVLFSIESMFEEAILHYNNAYKIISSIDDDQAEFLCVELKEQIAKCIQKQKKLKYGHKKS